jgi:hypothetical protein
LTTNHYSSNFSLRTSFPSVPAYDAGGKVLLPFLVPRRHFRLWHATNMPRSFPPMQCDRQHKSSTHRLCTLSCRFLGLSSIPACVLSSVILYPSSPYSAHSFVTFLQLLMACCVVLHLSPMLAYPVLPPPGPTVYPHMPSFSTSAL